MNEPKRPSILEAARTFNPGFGINFFSYLEIEREVKKMKNKLAYYDALRKAKETNSPKTSVLPTETPMYEHTTSSP